ncbi:MAG: hypothetical protein KFW09_00945 [Oscillospiraceae bacterium]|nr:hypothetical protein [Oscillospiraceae bacterium]
MKTYRDYIKNILYNHPIHAYLISYNPLLENKENSVFIIQFIKSILCNNHETFCDNCPSCNKINGNIHPDIHYIDSDINKKKISIDNIRNIISLTYIKPNEAYANIFCIQYCEEMSDFAYNSFLKTLENPNKNNIFILITKNKKLLSQTILSRVLDISIPNYNNISQNTNYELNLQHISLLIKHILQKDILSIYSLFYTFPKNNLSSFLNYLLLFISNIKSQKNIKISNSDILLILKIYKDLSNLIIHSLELSSQNINHNILISYITSKIDSIIKKI